MDAKLKEQVEMRLRVSDAMSGRTALLVDSGGAIVEDVYHGH
jgi:hypothetical protein